MSLTRFTLNSLNSTGMILIQNSSIGSIQTGAGFNVIMVDSYITGSDRIQETLLKVESSNVSLINTTFLHNVGNNRSIILEAKGSSFVLIEICTFLNNTGYGNVITAENDTVVQVVNSVFRSNVIVKNLCTIFSISYNSSIVIGDSKFSDNFAPAGGILRLK